MTAEEASVQTAVVAGEEAHQVLQEVVGRQRGQVPLQLGQNQQLHFLKRRKCSFLLVFFSLMDRKKIISIDQVSKLVSSDIPRISSFFTSSGGYPGGQLDKLRPPHVKEK